MNKIFKLLTALFVFVAIVACQKEPGVVAPSSIEVEATALTVDSRGESISLGYSIKNAIEGESLTVATEAEWVTAVVEVDKLTITVGGNYDDAERTAELTLKYKSATDVTITISQSRITAENPIEVELVDYDATTITISVLTADPATTWVPMVTYKESWDYYKGNQNDIFEGDLEYFKYLADVNDITLADFLSSIVGTGSEEAIRISQLSPETEYVVYVYGISLEGERTTDIIPTFVTTEPPHQGDITFEFSVKEEDFTLEYTVTPSHTGVDYYCGIMSEEELNYWKQLLGTNNLKEIVQTGSIDSTIELLQQWGYIEERTEFFSIYNLSDILEDGWFECKADTKYYIFAAKWNENCDIIGEVGYYEHTSAHLEPSSNVLTLELKNLTQSSVDVTVRTTTYDPYVVLPLRKDAVEGLNDDELFELITTEYDYVISSYTYEGTSTNTFSSMRPDSDYVIVAFGYKAGTLTTSQMWREEFHTLASGDPKDCTFQMTVIPSVDNAWIEIIPSDKGHAYHWMIYPAGYTAEDAMSYIKNTIIKRGYDNDYSVFASWELTQGDENTTVWDLAPDTDYKLGVVIMDFDECEFLSDVYFSDVFHTDAVEYADIAISIDIDKYFDVDELVAAGYEGFAMYAGNAMIPVKVNIEGECSMFYYDFYGNDLTDTEDYPDNIFYEYLWDGAPYESASFFLPFDKVMTVIAVAYDDLGNPSPLYREAVCFTREGCSTVEEYEAMQTSAKSAYVAPKSIVVSEPVVEARKSPATAPAICSDVMSADIKAKGEAMLKANAKRELDARKAKAAKMTRFVAR
ncbi:MAG: BACON domain-containing protein [Alistipes sp.]|nr:BACON domain-containing protein [Alistipes sp.]